MAIETSCMRGTDETGCRQGRWHWVWLRCALAAPAYAEKRVALVIGNNDYKNVPKLQKAVNDARTMGDTLKQLGFTVMVAENQTRQAFSQTLLAFDKAVEPGDTAFFFYAGHGFEIAGQNFLLPTDVPAATEGQEELVRDASVLADRIIERLQNKKVRTSILVFDACRNNPFERAGTRAVAGGGGLAPMTQLPEGVFSVFSAGPRQTALDRLSNNDDNPNSVFTRTFAKELTAARRQPGSGRPAHAPARQRDGGDRQPQADPGLFRPDGRRRVPERRCQGPIRSAKESQDRPSRRRRSRRCRRCRRRAWRRRTTASTRRSRCSRATMAAGPWCSRSPIRRSGFPGGWATPANSARPAFIDTLDPRTRKRMPNPSIELAADAPAATIQVRYVDIIGRIAGTVPDQVRSEAALIRDQRKILDMTATSWLSFREFNGLLVYYTHLMSYRCAIREVRIGIDSAVPDKVLKMPPCDPRDPSAIPHDAQPYLKLAPSTQFVSVELTYRDGSVSEIKSFRR